jgi:CRP-like cAMP-binding protein
VETLVGTKLFAGLDAALAGELAAGLCVEVAEADTELLGASSNARCLLLMLSGRAVISMRAPSGRELPLRSLAAGDFAGETGVVDPQPRTSRLTVTERAEVVRIPAQLLDGLYRREPKAYALVLLNIARELARRVRAGEQALVEAKDRA